VHECLRAVADSELEVQDHRQDLGAGLHHAAHQGWIVGFFASTAGLLDPAQGGRVTDGDRRRVARATAV
jgi:hypothetical protein